MNSYRLVSLSTFTLVALVAACGSSGDDGSPGGSGNGNGGESSGSGGTTVDFDGMVPDADEVRDESGVSILDPSHPFFDRLATVSQADEQSDSGDDSQRGTFRIKCDFSHALYDDPIVYPGEAGRAHLHMFFGNHTADADSTASSLAQNGETTCQGSELNRSSYWIPMLLAPRWEGDQPVQASDGARAYDPVLTIDSLAGENAGPDIYYKRAVRGTIFPMPEGLRMIVGSASAAAPQESIPVRFACESSVHSGNPVYSKSIPICNAGDILNVDVFFPSCWDGRNLDVPDHKSHMAFVSLQEDGTLDCPSTHPVPLPEVSYHFKYQVTAENGGPTGSTRGWKLASDGYEVPDDGEVGGYSLHADWFMAWHPEAVAIFTEYCINQGRHCANGDLGNGFRLERMVRGPQTIPEVLNGGLGSHAGH